MISLNDLSLNHLKTANCFFNDKGSTIYVKYFI